MEQFLTLLSEWWLPVLEIIGVCTLGSFVQRVSGFGFGIVTMIFLTRMMPSYGEATAICGIFGIVTDLFVIIPMHRLIKWKKLIYPSAAAMVFIVLAVIFMKKQPESILFILLGAVLIALSIWFMFFSKKVKIKDNPATGLICGSLSGVMSGLFSMGGPPVVIYFLQTSENRDTYIVMLQTFFFITGLWGVGVKAVAGYVTPAVLILAVFGLIGNAIGTGIGKKVYEKLSADLLRKIVYVFMALSGVITILKEIL